MLISKAGYEAGQFAAKIRGSERFSRPWRHLKKIADAQAVLDSWRISLILVILLICVYASALNKLFYDRFGPFYDSLAYLDQLAYVISIARERGFLAAAHSVLHTSTVLLPWLEAASLSHWIVGISRAVAIWLQAPWLLVLGLTGYEYFRRCARYSCAKAF